MDRFAEGYNAGVLDERDRIMAILRHEQEKRRMISELGVIGIVELMMKITDDA